MKGVVRTVVVSGVSFLAAILLVYAVLVFFRPKPDTEEAKTDGDALSVPDALELGFGKKTAVRGFVFIDEKTGPLLCSERSRDEPLTCEGVVFRLDNLDTSRLDLVVNKHPRKAYDAWARDEVVLFGEVDGAFFVVREIVNDGE